MAIITMSRKLGSQGDEMAALVAKKLGYRLLSREEFPSLGPGLRRGIQKTPAPCLRPNPPPGCWSAFSSTIRPTRACSSL